MKKRIFATLLTGILTVSAMAQVSSTLSPYSQYGLGTLSEQSLSFNRGMGGLAYGLRNSRAVNMQNPASYSAVDSLTMLIDMGVSGQYTHFTEGSKKVNANTGTFDYAVASFRLMRHVGLAVGVVPYSNIGYNYKRTEAVGNSQSMTSTEVHEGSGGLSQLFLGAGWQFTKGFSVGANLSYFWGRYDKTVVTTPSDSYVNTMTRNYSTSVSSYKIDLGLQWQTDLNKNDVLTLGLTAGIGHKLGAGADLQVINANSMTGTTTTTTITVPDAFALPTTVGFGGTVLHKRSLMAGLDYTYQRWSALDYPAFNAQAGTYTMTGGYYQDRHKVTGGVDWQPNPMGRKLYQVMHYRFGVSYATPYYKIMGQDGPKEFSVSAGFAVPISRSSLNISGQWVRSSSKSFLTEDSFRINIGLTFNERWFAKWKVD